MQSIALARQVLLKGFDAALRCVPFRYRVSLLQYGARRAQRLSIRARVMALETEARILRTGRRSCPNSGSGSTRISKRIVSVLLLPAARSASAVCASFFIAYRFFDRTGEKLKYEALREAAAERFGRHHIDEQRKLLRVSQQGDIEYCRRTYENYVASGKHEYLPVLADFYLKWGEIGRSFDALNEFYRLRNKASVNGRLDAAELLLRLKTVGFSLQLDHENQLGNRTTWSQLQVLFKNTNPSEMARVICDEILLLDKNERALLMRAESNYLDACDRQAAIDFEQYATSANPSARTYRMWYNVLIRSNDLDGAVRLLTLAREGSPDVFLSLRIGRLYMQRRQVSEGARNCVASARAASRISHD